MRRKGSRNRGNSLILVLMLVPVLVFLARSLSWLAQSSHFRSHRHVTQISRNYIVEAGLQHARAKLIENAAWVEGFDEEKMSRVDGSYSVVFQQPNQAYSEGMSVNNLLGASLVDGPRGPLTVEPGSVEIVVLATHASTESQGRFVFRAVHDDGENYALAAGGQIVMRGGVSVDGVVNTRGGEEGPGNSNDATWAQTPAGLHANHTSASDTAVAWDPLEIGDRAVFTGKVSTPSSGEQAIQFSGTEGIDYTVGEFTSGAASVGVTSPDILGEIALKTSAQSVSEVPFGTTTLANSDFYRNGDLDFQGDLVLDKGNLYVDGNLNVNGSISGEGSVYVRGTTSFKGDANVDGSDGAHQVAVYSHGPVSLTGFDGVEFMDSLRASNPEIDEQYAIFNAEMAEASDTTPDSAQANMANRAMDAITRVSQIVNEFVPEGSETSDFVRQQLTSFRDVVNATHADGTYSRREMRGVHLRIRYGLNRLGTAYFTGKLVSNSYISTDNDSGVVGAVWTSGTNSEEPPIDKDGVEVGPGDIFLGKHTSILLNKELLEAPESGAPKPLATLQQVSWDQ